MNKLVVLNKQTKTKISADISGIISEKELKEFWRNNGEDGWPDSVSDFFSIYEKYIHPNSYTDVQIWGRGNGQMSFADNIDASKIEEFIEDLKHHGYEVEVNF